MKDVWIDVFRDVFCDLSLWDSRHLVAADIRNDGRARLVALHSYRSSRGVAAAQTVTKALRVFHGTQLETERVVKSDATAIADMGHGVLAVAGGSAVYFFKELKPYYKFELKPQRRADQPTQREAQIWTSLKQRELDVEGALSALKQLKERDLIHCALSEELLHGDGAQLRQTLEANLAQFNTKTQSFSVQDVITCIAVLKRDFTSHLMIGSLSTAVAVSRKLLLSGTEMGVVVLLDETGTQEERRFDMAGPVQFLSTCAPNTVLSCCRNGRIQSLTGVASAVQDLVQLEAPCLAMVTVGMQILVGCVPSTVHCFNLDGTKEYSLEIEQPLRALTPMYIPSASAHGLLVTLQSGEMMIYHDQNRRLKFSMDSPVAAVTFGRYGTEDCVLSTVFKDGTLDIKVAPSENLLTDAGLQQVLKRNFALEMPRQGNAMLGDPLREVCHEKGGLDGEDSCDVHVPFQRHLQQLRLETIKAYTKLSVDGGGSMAENRDLQLQLRAEILGLGPKFKIRLEMSHERDGKSLQNLSLCLSADGALYRLRRRYFHLPWLLPGQVYTLIADVEAIEEGASSLGEIRALIIQDGLSYPLVTATIQIPVSHVPDAAL